MSTVGMLIEPLPLAEDLGNAVNSLTARNLACGKDGTWNITSLSLLHQQFDDFKTPGQLSV
jgi:hypothetical protein